jgi:hypothetical protein
MDGYAEAHLAPAIALQDHHPLIDGEVAQRCHQVRREELGSSTLRRSDEMNDPEWWPKAGFHRHRA